MKTIKILLISCCALLAFSTFAQQQISIEEAKRAAVQSLNFQQHRSATNYTTSQIRTVNSQRNRAGQTLMYETVFEDGRRVLLSGSRASLPMLGYFSMPEGRSIFDDDVSEGLREFLLEYQEQIEWSFQNDNGRMYYREKWAELQQDTNISRQGVSAASGIGNVVVAPLLTSRWGQRL